ncbi:MAG TPA: ABC transporter permease [Jiangellaceae bacterium]|nr:ABC transporter permease [Jiangellaceae bacterium]
MTAFAKLATVQTKTTLREPAAAFFMIALGPMLVLLLGIMFGNLGAHLLGFTAIVVAIVGFVLVPVDLVTQRENGALRRFRATPLRPLTYIAANVLVRFVLSLLSITAMVALGIAAFDASPQGSLVSVLGAAALGILAFLAVGYALAALLPSQGAALAAGNVIVYPLIFLSGAAIPLTDLPDGARQIAQFLPLTHLVELLQGLWAGQSWTENWLPLTVLLGTLTIATAIAARFFRWE